MLDFSPKRSTRLVAKQANKLVNEPQPPQKRKLDNGAETPNKLSSRSERLQKRIEKVIAEAKQAGATMGNDKQKSSDYESDGEETPSESDENLEHSEQED